MPTFEAVSKQYLIAADASFRTCDYVETLCGAMIQADPGSEKISRFGDLDVAKIVELHILLAANVLYPGCKNETKNRNAIKPARVVLNFATRNLQRSPIVVSLLPEGKRPSRRPAAGVLPKLVEATTGHQRALLGILAYQGWRISESIDLEPGGPDFDRMTLTLWVGKARREKTVVMNPKCAEYLLAAGAYSKDRFFPWQHRNHVYQWLRPLCRRLGVKFTPHQARHEFASFLHEQLRCGTLDIMKLGTWTSEDSVAPYIHPTDDYYRGLTAKMELR